MDRHKMIRDLIELHNTVCDNLEECYCYEQYVYDLSDNELVAEYVSAGFEVENELQ